jgi:hypothetical protein
MPPVQPMTKLPAEPPQLIVRDVPPIIPREQENLLVALAGWGTINVATRKAITNSKAANLAKE